MLGFSASRRSTPPAGVSAAADVHASAPSWRRGLVRAAVVYAISRLCVLAGAGIVAAGKVVEANDAQLPRPRSAVSLVTDVLTSWDGRWYFEIVRHGYPRTIPPDVTFHMVEARAAFFPAYPAVVRALDRVLPGGDVAAGLALNIVLGAVVIAMVGVLARELFDDRVAARAMTLAALFPGSFVLSFTYAEATLMVLAAACLLCLHRQRWAAAGILAALGAATRPNGLALVAACAVASAIAIAERRAWRSLVAPLMAPIGFVGFRLFLGHHTGEAGAWFRVQREAWDEGWSFGWSAIDGTWNAFAHPLTSPTDVVTAACVAATIGLCVVAVKRRLPWPMMAYSAAVVALMILPSTVTARPRFLFTAFPLFISLAAWFEDRARRRAAPGVDPHDLDPHGLDPHDLDPHDDVWVMLCALSAAGLVAVTGLYGVYGAIP